MSSQPLVDPEQLIARAEPGTMVYAAVEHDGQRQIALMIRETTSRLKRLPRTVVVETRAGVLVQADVAVVVVMARTSQDLYECWWNYHQPGILPGQASGSGADLFALAATTPQLLVLFVGDGSYRRALGLANRHQEFFAQAATISRSQPAWGMADFDAAKARLQARYPRLADLWRALGRPEWNLP